MVLPGELPYATNRDGEASSVVVEISRHLGVDDGLEIEVALPAAPNVDLPLIPFFSPFRGPKCERRAYAVVDIVASPRFVPLPRRSRQNNGIVDFTVNCCELL